MKKVTVFGSFVVDLMGRTPHLPVPGETVKGTFFRQGAGGKGFNQAIAAKKTGADLTLITKLGRDSMASIAEDAMKSVGLSKEHLLYSDDTATGVALITVDENTSQNEIVVIPGACGTITDEDIENSKEAILSSDYLLTQLEVNQDANGKAVALAKENNVKVICNTAPYQPVNDEFFDGMYLVTPNETEAEALTGVAVTDLPSAHKAAEWFLARGVENVVITLGGKGAYVLENGKEMIFPAYKVNAIDTTGAGDAFNGGLLTALAEGKDLFEAVKFASAVAALSVQKLGTTPSMPTREEVIQFIAEHS